MVDFRVPNFKLSNEQGNLTLNRRVTIPLNLISQNPVQRKGSLFFDTRTLKLYYSDGANWIEIGVFNEDVCIQDADGSTSVCTDTIPETNSDTIYFTTGGTLRSIFNPNGIFIATAGAVNPTTIVPAAGKVAYFGGDIDVTGVVDPTGVQFEEQATTPVDPTGGTTGVIYVRNDNPNVPIFVDNAGVEHNLLAAAAGVWQEVSSVISPVTATETSVICGGVSNTLNSGSSSCVIAAGDTCNISGGVKTACFCVGSSCSVAGTNTATGCSVLGGISNAINTNPSGGIVNESSIVAGTGNTISGPCSYCAIVTGNTNSITRAQDSLIACGSNCFFTGTNVQHTNSFICGDTNSIQGSTQLANACAILGGSSNEINTNFSASATLNDSCIIGGNLNTIASASRAMVIIGGTSNGTGRGIGNVIAAGNTCSISGSNVQHQYCFMTGSSNTFLGDNRNNNASAIIGGTSNTINSQSGASGTMSNNVILGGDTNLIQNSSNSVVCGTNATANNSNCFIYSVGTALSTSTSNQFTVKAAGGSRIFSNDLATTGVTLAPGAGAWAAVSDRNKKENLIEVSYFDILKRVEDLPIYNYNFIGNPKEQKCIGPVAQDWHSKVTPLETIVVVEEDEYGVTKSLEKEAKDKLSIETMDAIGVCLAAIKALKIELDEVKEENRNLKLRMESIENKNM